MDKDIDAAATIASLRQEVEKLRAALELADTCLEEHGYTRSYPVRKAIRSAIDMDFPHRPPSSS